MDVQDGTFVGLVQGKALKLCIALTPDANYFNVGVNLLMILDPAVLIGIGVGDFSGIKLMASHVPGLHASPLS